MIEFKTGKVKITTKHGRKKPMALLKSLTSLLIKWIVRGCQAAVNIGLTDPQGFIDAKPGIVYE